MKNCKIWINNRFIESAVGNSYEDLAYATLGDNGNLYLAREAARNAFSLRQLIHYLVPSKI
jgi:hypothetical protein